jgi:GDPmannose 4,6-dehydratase
MIDYLLKNTSHEIVGGARRLSVENHINIAHLENEPRFQLVNFDLTDGPSMYKLMSVANPDYFINFAAQSFVHSSWDFADQTSACNNQGVLNCLRAIQYVKPTCRFYNAGSSEEFGNVIYDPQDENHPPRPRSPYGSSKVAARQHVKVFRESYGMYTVQGWLFNHEGTRRGEEFVTRKITKSVARIKKALDNSRSFEPIELGNLDAKRDWSDAEDMVDAVWRMLNQDSYNKFWLPTNPLVIESCKDLKNVVPHIKDYVVSSDENHSIREFVEEAFKVVNINGLWGKNGLCDPLSEQFNLLNDNGIISDLKLVKINPKFYRPAEVDILCGNSSLIRKELGWQPKTSFKELVKKMVLNDLK